MEGRNPMFHKGVEYTVRRATTPGFWQWEFRIGDKVRVGETETKLEPLAQRRAQIRIDRELKKILPGLPSRVGH
jgi:hypothetical protein